MPSAIHLLLLSIFISMCYCHADAQPGYTKMRAAFAVDAGGIAPETAVSAEVPVYHGKNGFLNIQAGLGLAHFSDLDSLFSTSFSTTYNWILNRYHRNLCKPWPAQREFELHLETGLASSAFNPRNLHIIKNRFHLHQMGILGLRTHYVSKKWFYIFKVRATPFLTPDFQFWAGASAGIGWR